MQVFTVYPRGTAEPFTLTCKRFEVKDERFVLYGEERAAQGFLSFQDIAAIIPDQSGVADLPYPNTLVKFLLYLKDRARPVEILAHAFENEEGTCLVFKRQERSMMGEIKNEWPVNDIYVSTSEVIAVLPSGGLVSRR